MKVPFLDLAAQHAPLRDDLLREWSAIVDEAQFVSGARVEGFETAFAAAHQASHCVAVANGTVALELPLRALGVGPGDEVAIPANTFIATAEAITNAGATPRFVDIDPATCNIDPAQLADVIARHPAIVGTIAVHLYGQPADLDALSQIAASTDTWLIEDAAQAHLARLRERPVGTAGLAGAFSFYPGKNLGAPGEGGAVTTNDDALARDLRARRDHGQIEKYRSDVVGTNARMAEFVAAALTIKLRHLEAWTERRRTIAARYRQALVEDSRIDLISTPDWSHPVWHLFVVRVDNRDDVRRALSAKGVGTGLHYPVPVHLQPAYAHLQHTVGDFPQTEQSAARLLSLPIYENLTDVQVDYVIDAVLRSINEVTA